MLPERTAHVSVEPIGIVCDVDISWDHCKVGGNMILIWPLRSILLVGTIETIIAPVVLTAEGLKLTLQLEKLAAWRVTDELRLLYDTSAPIWIIKGLVLTAG